MLLARGSLAGEFETPQTDSQKSALTQHLTATSSPHHPSENDSISNESASIPRATRDEKPIEFVGARDSEGESATRVTGKRRRSESVESTSEIPPRETATEIAAARIELDTGKPKAKENIARELSIWEKLVFTFDRARDVDKDQVVEMDRGGDSVGAGGSGKGPGRTGGGEWDGKGAERERGLGSGSRRGATPSSSAGPAGIVSPVPTRSGSVSGSSSTNPNLPANRRIPPLVGPGGNLHINTGDASSSAMARTHSQQLSTSPLHQTHLPPSSHQQQPSLQEHSSPSHPLLTPVNTTPIQGPFGALDPFTVAQLAAISAMYPQSGVPDPYELINRAQRAQGPGYSPTTSSASGYSQQQQHYAQQQQQMSAGLNSPVQQGHSAPAHPHHRTHPHQQHHGQGAQHPQMMSPASSSAQWQTSSLQHMGQLSLHPTHPQQGSSAHGQVQGLGQQHLGYGHNYPDLFAQPSLAGSSRPSAPHGHGERAMPSSSHSSSHSLGYASSSSPPMSPGQQEAGQADLDDPVIAEDKRRRNTLASARFRIKKKHKIMELERSVVELEGRADDLEREASDLRRENGWLKEMLIMKGRRARGLEGGVEESKESSDEDEEDEEGAAGGRNKGKGKEKEKGA